MKLHKVSNNRFDLGISDSLETGQKFAIFYTIIFENGQYKWLFPEIKTPVCSDWLNSIQSGLEMENAQFSKRCGGIPSGPEYFLGQFKLRDDYIKWFLVYIIVTTYNNCKKCPC